MNKNLINYSQCWEDPAILLEALSINQNDNVLSITSGGDNTLALFLARPNKITSIDLNYAQNYLLELKIAAARALSYGQYLEFLGVKDSRSRNTLFKKVRGFLSSGSGDWWLHHQSFIDKGVINCGRFERFTIWFAQYILPFIHSRKTILKFLTINNLEQQTNFYQNHWDSKLWRLCFGLASSRLALKRFARQHSMFKYSGEQTIAEIYRKRLEKNLSSVSIKSNFFLHYSLTGKYGGELPMYLQEKNLSNLKGGLTSIISIETMDLLNYLKSVPANTFSKYNLSDIFEALSPGENDMLWEEIVRTSKNAAVVVHWNNLVKRSYPVHLSNYIQTNEKKSRELHIRDRVFFYDSFHINTIIK